MAQENLYDLAPKNGWEEYYVSEDGETVIYEYAFDDVNVYLKIDSLDYPDREDSGPWTAIVRGGDPNGGLDLKGGGASQSIQAVRERADTMLNRDVDWYRNEYESLKQEYDRLDELRD